MVQNLQRVRVDVNGLRLFFKIDINIASSIRCGKFRSAAQVNGANHFSVRRVNHRGVIAVTVHREDVLGTGIINNRVRFLSDLDFTQRL